MEKNFTIQTPPYEAATIPGPLFPDRCLECPELLGDGYGCVKCNKCVDCVAASLRQKRQRTISVRNQWRPTQRVEIETKVDENGWQVFRQRIGGVITDKADRPMGELPDRDKKVA